jgi:hypothetical protein
MKGGQTARAVLWEMQRAATELYHELSTLEGNGPNVSAVLVALHDVLKALDVAVTRAGRV